MFLLSDPYLGAGLAGLLFLIIGGVAYGSRGAWDAWSIVPLVLAAAGIAAYLAKHYKSVRQAVGSRRARFGANSLILTLAVLAALVFTQAIVSNHNHSWDISSNHANSLSDETRKAVKGLSREVNIYAFFADNGREEFNDLLRKVRDLNPGKLKFEFINPNKRPLLAQQYSVKTFGSTVVTDGTRQELINSTKEEDLVNAIVKVTSGSAKTVYFLKGHQELPIEEGEASASEFKRALENSNYVVKDVNLVESQKVPDDCATLIMAGPQVDYPEAEIGLIKAYLAKGGHLMAMLDPRRPLKNVKRLLSDAGVKLDDDVVVDPLSAIFGGDPIQPITSNFDRNHPVTKGQAMQVILPVTRSVDQADKVPSGAEVTVLARSNPTAWAYMGSANMIPSKPGPGDKKGPLPLVVAASVDPKVFGAEGSSSTAKAELVVYGTSAAFSNRALGVYNNQDLGINSVRWMTADESHISIAPKDPENTPLIVPRPRMSFIWILCLLLLPGAILVSGVVVGVRRSREAA